MTKKTSQTVIALFALISIASWAATLNAQITTYPYQEDFETHAQGSGSGTTVYNFTNGWTEQTSAMYWQADAGGTTSTGTGPTVDSNPGTSTGKYIYLECTQGSTGNEAIVRSPTFDYSSLTTPAVIFSYHMLGATMGNMHFDLVEIFNSGTDGGNTGTSFSSATATFTAAHVGGEIVITGGANAGSYMIAAFVNSTTVTLSTTPPSDLTGMAFEHVLNTQDAVTPWTDNQNLWQTQAITLSSLLVGGGSIEHFAFFIRGTKGTSFTGDMAFDDVRVTDGLPPAIGPATGSQFDSTLTMAALQNATLTSAVLDVDDSDSATIDISINSSNPAPGVTAPTGGTGVTMPTTLTWSGTPTTLGTYTYTVTLDDGSGAVPYIVTIDVVDTLSITTQFGGGTTGGNGGNAFDLTTGTSPILVTQFDIHMSSTTSQVVDFYYKVGTYSGFEQNPGAWTLHDTVTVTGAGANNPTPMPLNSPLLIPANSTYGFAILARTTALRYTSGTATYSDSFVTLDLGSQVATGFTGSIAGREWNGSVYYQPNPDGVVLANSALAGGASGTGLTDFVSMDFEAFALTNGRDLNSVTFTNTGTAPDTVFTAVELVRDDNDNGVIDATDTVLGTGTLSGGSITYNSAPLPQTVTTAAPVRLLLGVTTSGLTVGDSFLFEITSSSDIAWSGGTDFTGYPFQGPNWIVSGPASSYPYTLGFETPEPYFNGNFDNTPTSVPTVVSVGGAPGTDTLTSTLNDYVVTTGPVSGSSPHSGSFMLDFFGGSSAGAVALDLEFDMSAFSLTDYVELEFWWNDEGLDSSTLTNDRMGVFVSTNGGTTWELAVYQFDVLGPEGVWNQVVLDLSPMLSALSLTYTNQMVIRFQSSQDSTLDHLLLDDIRVDRPAAQLRVEPAPGLVSSVFGGGTDQVVAEVGTFSINSTQTLDSITLSQIGTATNSDLSNLKLWEDTNNDGVFSTGDTQLGTTVATFTGTVTFSATPLRTYTLNERKTIFVTADIVAAPTVPADVQFSVTNSSDVTATPGFSGGTYPVDFAPIPLKVPVSTFPYVQDFETALPYTNGLLGTNGTSVPTVAAVGGPAGAPTTYTAPGGFAVTAGPIVGSPPNNGTGMLDMFGGTGNGYVSLDLLFDMSAYSVATDTFNLQFFWNDEGIDNFGVTNDTQGVFLSTNGGATWDLALFLFPHSFNTGIWNQEDINLSAIMATAGLNFTSQMVLRFQMAENSTADHLLLDDITLDVATTAELNVSTGPAELGFGVAPGATDAVIGSFRFDAVASTQTVSGITVTKTGTLADSELTAVRLYEDTNSDNVFNAGDTLLGTPGVFSSGTIQFVATTLVVIPGTAPTLFVTADIAGTAPTGDTVGVSIVGGVLDINTSPGGVAGNYPVSGGSNISVLQYASTPAYQDFESATPFADTILTNESVLPTVVSVGAAPGVGTVQGVGTAFVATAPVLGSNAVSGTQLLDLAGATGGGGAAVNLFYDMASFTTSDVVQLSFFWNDEGLDPDTTTVFTEKFSGVFISTDGGLTWNAAAFQFPHALNTGIWNQETINLSTILSGLSLTYTSNMVIRFQIGENSTADHLLLDDIRVEVAQEIDVLRNTTSIPNNGFEVVGPIPVSTNQTFTIDISNVAPTGANDLQLTGTPTVQIGATTNATVNITSQPAVTTLATGASDSFDVEISPNAGGAYVVELIIPNDDPDEAPYIITLVGTGVEPEIDVQRPAGTSIPDGSTDPFGSIAAGVSNMYTYFIVNGGNATLNLTGTPAVDIQNVVNATVNVTAQPSSTALAPAAVAPFDLDVTPNLGAFSFDIVITNNDANEGNYTISVTGNGATTPEIDVKDSVGTDVFEGGVFTLGNIAPGSTQPLTLTIENNGNADLLLTGTPTIEILSPSNVTANVTVNPATTIAIGNSDIFTMDITPASTGSFSFQVRIQNNDANEGTYTFTISGFSSAPVSGGGGGGDGGGGCSTGDTDLGLWSLLLGALALIAVATRVRASRD